MTELQTRELNLLPHQYELITDEKTQVLGLVSGVGGGKTFAVGRKAVMLMLKNIGFDGIVTEPNYPLLVQILIPEIAESLRFFNIRFSFSKADMIFTCYPDGVETRIICKSLENYERLIGINAAWIIMDEFDTSKEGLAYNAYLKLLGRMRVGNLRQMVIVSTPEGFAAMYRIFIKEADQGNKRLIKAKTTDNKYLPDDFIKRLYDIYPDQLIQAYINGEFVNLTSSTVYSEFNRIKNATNRTIQDNETLHVGMDFNVGKMFAVVHVLDDDKPRAVLEYSDVLDTPAMCSLLKERHPNHKIIVYPDASGRSRKSVNASESDLTVLRSAGFSVFANNRNPAVKDRLMAVNAKFKSGDYLVNIDGCPLLVESFEKQAYDKHGEPDKTSGYDHGNDAAGYFIVYRYPINRNDGIKFKLKGL